MKRIGYLYQEITDMKKIIDIYTKYVKKNTKNKRKVEVFENYLVENLAHIKTVLEKQDYRCGRYTIFLIKEPKLRIVMSQSIADKIVNELVAKYILLPALDPCLIEGNVATRKGKGSNAGIYLLKKYLLEYRGKPIYVLKFDVSKYFYNIDHSILKQKLRTKIKDQSVLTLLDNIIDSTNLSYINETISNLKQSRMKKIENSKITAQEKERLFLEIERLPYYQKDDKSNFCYLLFK